MEVNESLNESFEIVLWPEWSPEGGGGGQSGKQTRNGRARCIVWAGHPDSGAGDPSGLFADYCWKTSTKLFLTKLEYQ